MVLITGCLYVLTVSQGFPQKLGVEWCPYSLKSKDQCLLAFFLQSIDHIKGKGTPVARAC